MRRREFIGLVGARSHGPLRYVLSKVACAGSGSSWTSQKAMWRVRLVLPRSDEE